MNKAKKVLITLGAGCAMGFVLGVLYAPDKGSETREKLARLKRKFSCCGCDDEEIEDLDKETLEEVSAALQEQLEKVNRRLGQ